METKSKRRNKGLWVWLKEKHKMVMFQVKLVGKNQGRKKKKLGEKEVDKYGNYKT